MSAYATLMGIAAELRQSMEFLADPAMDWHTYRHEVKSLLKRLGECEAAVMEEDPIRLPDPEVDTLRIEATKLLRETETPREVPSHLPISVSVSLELYHDLRIKANTVAAHFTGRKDDHLNPEQLVHALIAAFSKQDMYAEEFTFKRDDLVKFINEQRSAK